MSENQTRVIRVQVDVKGEASLGALKQTFSGLNKTMKDSQGLLASINQKFNLFLGASFLGLGVTNLTQLADSMQLLFDRIKIFEGGTEQAKYVMDGLFSSAQMTASSIDGLAVVYSRTAMATKELGLNSDQLLGITTALQQSFRLSGSTQAEATAATIQLNQGLASGALRGQELRSVLEQNVVIGELLSKELGVGRGQLMKYAEAGKITSEVVLKALAKNFNKLNEDASKMGQTFEQTLIKATNRFKVAIEELNRELGISSGFAKFMDFILNNGSAITAAIVGIGTAIAVTMVPAVGALTTAFSALAFVTTTFLNLNIWAVAIGAIVGSLIYLYTNFDLATLRINKAIDYVRRGIFALVEGATTAFGNLLALVGKDELSKVFLNLAKGFEGKGIEIASEIGEINKEIDRLKTGGDDDRLKKMQEALAKLQIKPPPKAALSLKQQLEALNTAFNEGTIPVQKYNSELFRLTDAMSEKKGPTKHFMDLYKVLKENLGRELEYGIITLKDYTDAMYNMDLGLLEYQWARGAVSAAEYHKQIVAISREFQPSSALYTGTQQYLTSVGTTSQQVASAISSTFGRLEDSLVEFIRKGTFEFSKFTEAILDDLTRIIVRAAIIQPLANGILGSFSPGANTGNAGNTNVAPAKNGFAPSGTGVTMFANGGVVNNTTPFTYGGSKQGIMGEAGPEAIMPLTRHNGVLGVQASQAPVVININNESDAQISQKESVGSDGSKSIEILITNTVKEGMAKGSFDRQLKQSYGLNRRGA